MQPTDGLHLIPNKYAPNTHLPDWEENPLPTDIWNRIMHLFSVPDHLNMGRVSKYFCILECSVPYWTAVLRDRFPGTPLTMQPCLEYQRCHRVHHNIASENYETTSVIPIVIPIAPIAGLSEGVPAAMSVGSKYIAVQEESGLVKWFDICTKEEKGRLPLERPLPLEPPRGCRSIVTPLLHEQGGLIYAYFRYPGSNQTAMAAFRVICPGSNEVLCCHAFLSGVTKNTRNELFKIFNDQIYIRENDKSIRMYNLKDMDSYKILTGFSEGNALDVVGFDIDKNSHLHVTLLGGDCLIIKSVFKIVDGNIVRIAEVKTGVKISPIDPVKMSGTHIYTWDCMGQLRKIEVDLQEETPKVKVIKFQDAAPNNEMQFGENCVFAIDEEMPGIYISNASDGTLIGEIPKTPSIMYRVSSYTMLCVKENTVTFVDGEDKTKQLESLKRMDWAPRPSLVIRTINFDIPIKLAQKNAARLVAEEEHDHVYIKCKPPKKKREKCSIQ